MIRIVNKDMLEMGDLHAICYRAMENRSPKVPQMLCTLYGSANYTYMKNGEEFIILVDL